MFLDKVEQCGRVATASVHVGVFLIPKKTSLARPGCSSAHV